MLVTNHTGLVDSFLWTSLTVTMVIASNKKKKTKGKRMKFNES